MTLESPRSGVTVGGYYLSTLLLSMSLSAGASLTERLLTHGAAFTSWRYPEAAALTPDGRARAAQKLSTAATMAALVSERRSGVPNSSSVPRCQSRSSPHSPIRILPPWGCPAALARV